MPVGDQLLRITFKSGKIFEEVGTWEAPSALFDADKDDLLDFVIGIDLVSGGMTAWTRPDDTRLDDFEALFPPAMRDVDRSC